jgi:hypothetical protein
MVPILRPLNRSRKRTLKGTWVSVMSIVVLQISSKHRFGDPYKLHLKCNSLYCSRSILGSMAGGREAESSQFEIYNTSGLLNGGETGIRIAPCVLRGAARIRSEP